MSGQQSATLRPRNKRLVSVDDDFETIETGAASSSRFSDSQFSPFSTSRTTSPIPSTLPSRSTSILRTTEDRRQGSSFRNDITAGGIQGSSSGIGASIWESWTSLQGIASTILGSDTNRSLKDRGKKTLPGYKSPQRTTNARLDQWGPSTGTKQQTEYGSQEDRLQRLQAKKRETLLAANGHAYPDSTGNYKRRKSEDGERTPTDEQEQDALVYLHKVQPDDTIAGVAIKYHCPLDIFRKANRLWPNDRVQIRDTVYLPVDSCGVKGRKVHEPSPPLDLLASGDSSLDPSSVATHAPSYPDFENRSRITSAPRSMATSPSLSTSNPDQIPPWKHDSWVIIEPSPVAIEIARVSRRTLGFFPPSRRKSVSYSDLETPSRSLDLSRSSLHRSPARLASPPRPSSPMRYLSPRRTPSKRSPSTSSSTNPLAFLSGPGGVGTLDTNVRSPGPAQDKLTTYLAQHFPSLAPQPSFEPEEGPTPSTGVENVGGTIEGWMRKMATKAVAVVQTPPLRGKAQGDLIELVEGWDLDSGGDTETFTPERVGRGRIGVAGRGSDTTSGRADDEGIEERFPARGRVFEDRGRRKGV